MTTVLTVYGLACLLGAALFALRLLLSASFRRRSSAGGRNWQDALGMITGSGIAALASGQLDGALWPFLPVAGGIIWSADRRRKALTQAQARTQAGLDLAPSVQRLKDAPPPTDLLRHPWRSTKANLHLMWEAFSATGRQQEREWDREHDLR